MVEMFKERRNKDKISYKALVCSVQVIEKDA
jgi:hypothetical protein